jgi:hypothetical protein
MVGNDFNPASVIWCHISTSVVAYEESSVLFKENLLSVPKRTQRIFLASDENRECVENHT